MLHTQHLDTQINIVHYIVESDFGALIFCYSSAGRMHGNPFSG